MEAIGSIYSAFHRYTTTTKNSDIHWHSCLTKLSGPENTGKSEISVLGPQELKSLINPAISRFMSSRT